MAMDQLFPLLRINSYQITSSATTEYNCIAWAACETDRWWWPDPLGISYWPNNSPRAETLEAFIQTFQASGYQTCDTSDLEPGLEKIAIFTKLTGKPTHIARQRSNGRWTSKIGELEDIEHELESLVGDTYGVIAQIMRRASIGPE